LRGKSWSVEEERQLRQLVLERKSLEEISKTMGKTRVAVKAKFFNLGLNFLKDATPSAKQTVASAAVSSTEAPVVVHAPSAVEALLPKSLREKAGFNPNGKIALLSIEKEDEICYIIMINRKN
jgi:hypothetical protein